MTGKGALSTNPNRRMRWMLIIHLLWAALICGIVIWWREVILRQARRVDELQRLAGILESSRPLQSLERMLWWESFTAIVLLLSITGVLVWYYWRDSRRSRSIQAFFASMTHELRTPLTSIRLQSESISDSLEGADEGTQLLVRRLLEDAQRLESQVERTLELARVEGGGAVHLQAMPLKAWLERQVAQLTEAWAGRIRVHLEVPESVRIQADPAALQVILRNTFENSLRHSGNDPVELRIGASSMIGGRISLMISDNGIGHSGDDKDLGQLFHRGEGSSGAGVGLYLIRVLTERMGGRADFRGTERGFETRLELPEATLAGGGR